MAFAQATKVLADKLDRTGDSLNPVGLWQRLRQDLKLMSPSNGSSNFGRGIREPCDQSQAKSVVCPEISKDTMTPHCGEGSRRKRFLPASPCPVIPVGRC